MCSACVRSRSQSSSRLQQSPYASVATTTPPHSHRCPHCGWRPKQVIVQVLQRAALYLREAAVEAATAKNAAPADAEATTRLQNPQTRVREFFLRVLTISATIAFPEFQSCAELKRTRTDSQRKATRNKKKLSQSHLRHCLLTYCF